VGDEVVLVGATDGVGTKLKIAFAAGGSVEDWDQDKKIQSPSIFV
jgi:phosphoribosylaminoimidazole (AIR) synthetase